MGVNLSYGNQRARSEQKVEQQTHAGSQLTAGRDLRLQATQGDIDITGSQLKAGRDTTLSAARDILLHSSQDNETLSGKNSSHGGSLGVGIGASGNSAGISISASVNASKGKENGTSLAHQETTLDSGGLVTLHSGRDTTLTGAQVNGERIAAQVGRNLTLTSEQDSNRYDSKQQSASAGGSFTFGSMTGSGSFNLSQDKMHSTYDSVQEQTGLFAGKGGFDVKVGEHTQLNGAVMGSTASAEHNRLETGTLGFSDIENQAAYKVEHQSVGASTGAGSAGNFIGNLGNALAIAGNKEKNDSSTTHAAVSDGTIVVRNVDGQQQNIKDLSRDVEHANQTLSPIFDKEKEQQRMQTLQLIGEVGNQAADIARKQGEIAGVKAQSDPAALEAARAELMVNGNSHPTAEQVAKQAYQTAQGAFGTGSSLQQAITASTAAIQGLAGGDIAKALAGGAAPYLAEVIHRQTTSADDKVNKPANLMAHAVVNAALSLAKGENALAGASSATIAEAVGMISKEYYDKNPTALKEDEKQTVSALASLAAGLAGGLVGGDTASAVSGMQTGKVTVENNYLNSNEVIKLNKELENADKNGTDKLEIYEKFAEISKKNREEAVAKSCSGDPFCASGVLAEAEAGTDVATSLRRLPIFSSLSSDDLSQLDRFVLAENEESARAIYQSLPEYVKVALYTKEAGETIGFGAAVGGKGLSALGVIGKGGKQSHQPNQGAVGNMGEFLKNSSFGGEIKNATRKTSKQYQGQSIYQAQGKTGDVIKKGDQLYLDAKHKNHLEVFDKSGNFKAVLNLDGSVNLEKTDAGKGRKLKID